MKVLNSPAIRRMPTYLHKLLRLQKEGRTHVSTTELAEYMNTELIVVRKDIALTGISGLRRVGYDVDELITYIKKFLGWQNSINATLIGAGSLGSALLGYDDFSCYGFNITSVFDCNPEKVGRMVHGHQVCHIDDMAEELSRNPADVAVICVSNASAQQVADKVVAQGIKYIWNFANVALMVPPEVIIQREVIAGGLAMLGVKIKLSSQ